MLIKNTTDLTLHRNSSVFAGWRPVRRSAFCSCSSATQRRPSHSRADSEVSRTRRRDRCQGQSLCHSLVVMWLDAVTTDTLRQKL